MPSYELLEAPRESALPICTPASLARGPVASRAWDLEFKWHVDEPPETLEDAAFG